MPQNPAVKDDDLVLDDDLVMDDDIILDEPTESPTILGSLSEAAGGIKDVGMGLLQTFNPIGEPTKGDPLSEYLGFSLQNPARRMAEGMVESARGSYEDFSEGDPVRGTAGIVDIAGLPASRTLDLTREGNYSRAAGTGIAGAALALLGSKAGKTPKAEFPIPIERPAYLDMIPKGTKTVELKTPPPAQPKVKGLLPEGRHNDLIANETGRVQRRNLITPQEEARLAGYDVGESGPIGKKGQPSGTSIDLGELRELERQESLRYTDRDLQGGTPLLIEPKPNTHIPAKPYSERMSFEEFTRSGDLSREIPSNQLEYPLNVIPSAVMPRRIQTIMEAIVPERFNEPIPLETKLVPESAKINKPVPTKPAKNYLGGTAAIQPGENILPSAAIRVSNRKAPPHIAEQELNLSGKAPFEDRVDNFIKQNAPEAFEQTKAITAVGRNTLQKLADETLISGEHQLERMGPVGREIHKYLAHVDHTKRELFNRYADPFIKATEKLNKEEMANLADAVEGLAEPISDNVHFAVGITRQLTDQLGAEAVANKVRVKDWKGRIRDFEPIGNYWPHKPTTPPNRAGFIDDLLATNPGMTRDTAMKLSQRFSKESEFFASPQHGRWPGKFNYTYRKDMNAMIDHIADMADIVARAKHLGPGDIAKSVKSPINQLIESSPDPIRAHELVRTHIRGGMDKNSEFYQAVKKVNNFVTRTQVFSKLGLFPISAYNNQLLTAMKGSIGETTKAFAKATFGSQELTDLAREYGTVSVGRVPLDILSEANTQPVRFTGSLVNWAENMQRTIATGAGKGTARTLFQNAKAGNVRSARRLSDLLLEPIDNVLKQNELTPEQLKFATQRFVEITQQLGSNRKIPPLWANEPLIQIPLIFKKFAFQGTKAIKDTIMENPVRNIPMLLVGSQLLGELTGDLKAIVTGAVRGGVDVDNDVLTAIAHQLGHRHKYAGKILHLDADESDFNWLVNRLAANLMQSWALGIPGDALQAAIGGKDAIKTFMLGPAVDQASSVIGATATGNVTQLGREALRTVPVAGPGLQQGLLPTKNQEIQP